MKRMRDKSTMSGVKILGEFKLVSDGIFWRIYKESDNSYLYIFSIRKLSKESNANLYEYVSLKEATNC